jgi:glycosyltransferase involved in cell wall biosynthesis
MIRVFVSLYNYEAYILECLESVLSQTDQGFLCTVVDDGSTDGGGEVASAFCKGKENFVYHRKVNEGQLSVFNFAAESVDEEDWVFFLDADDVWAPEYLEIVMSAKNKWLKECDLIFTGIHSDKQRLDTPSPCETLEKQHCSDLGYTSAVTRAFYYWIGNVTSSISLSGKLLKQILPYPYESEWRVRADDCLIFGSSIVGARKGHIRLRPVYYRVHGQNNYAGGDMDAGLKSTFRTLALERFFQWLCNRESLPLTPSTFLVQQELGTFNAWNPHNLSGSRPKSALVVNQWPLLKRLKIYWKIRKALAAFSKL